MNVYIKPGCPWCTEAVAYLNQKGYEFTTVDVISDPEKFEEMRQISGQTLAPTMTVGDLLLADFGVDELKEFIEEHDLRP